MSRVADRILEIIDRVDSLSKFNSQAFQEIKKFYGEDGEEFKMIKEIDSKIDDLLTLLNDEDESSKEIEMIAKGLNVFGNPLNEDQKKHLRSKGYTVG